MILDVSDQVAPIIIDAGRCQLARDCKIFKKKDILIEEYILKQDYIPRIVTAKRLIISRNVSDLYNSLNDVIIRQFEIKAIIPNDLVHFLTYSSDLSLIV